MLINGSNVRRGQFIKQNGDVWQVLKHDHNFRGRGSATLRAKVKSLTTGKTLELTFKGDANVELLDVEARPMQYLYKDANDAFFMDPQNYDQHQINLEIIGSVIDYIKEGDNIQVLFSHGKAIAIRPPQSVKLKVTEAEDAIKGDTATSTKKIVTLETGIKISVPLFIKTGDIIVVNPETDEYVERVNK